MGIGCAVFRIGVHCGDYGVCRSSHRRVDWCLARRTQLETMDRMIRFKENFKCIIQHASGGNSQKCMVVVQAETHDDCRCNNVLI